MTIPSVLWRGLLAGVLAGLLLGLMQFLVVGPIILQAESFETAGGAVAHAGHDHHHDHDHAHATGWKRSVLTIFGGTALGVALGLIASLLMYSFPQEGFRTRWGFGLLFGVCGFLAFHGIPSLGLPPPPPGVVGAEGDFESRRAWWMLAVGASTMGFLALALVPHQLRTRLQMKAMPSGLVAGVLAIGLFAVPFLRGVPEHASFTEVPDSLRHTFWFASLGTSAVFWLVLGALTTALLSRVGRGKEMLDPSTA